jgi:hypothetical protein
MSRNQNDARTEDCGPDAVDADPFGEEEPRDTVPMPEGVNELCIACHFIPQPGERFPDYTCEDESS